MRIRIVKENGNELNQESSQAEVRTAIPLLYGPPSVFGIDEEEEEERLAMERTDIAEIYGPPSAFEK